MQVKIKVEKEVDIKTLIVEANVRHWEDASIDGEEDTEGVLTPCRKGELWNPIIDIDKGIITNWKAGVMADIHFKVCDEGTYTVLDDKGDVVKKIEGYVPTILCPSENGFGDYIIMIIEADGKIKNWNPKQIWSLLETDS